MERQFNSDAPNTVWVTNITYVWTLEVFVYLTNILDLFSRKIIAWDISNSLAVTSTLKVVQEAIDYRFVDKMLILHSGRENQFILAKYREITHGITLSYSDKTPPWDNAVIEAFHAIIKREWLHRFLIQNMSHARTLIFDYIHTFYNSKRIHATCDCLAPDDFELNFLTQRAFY